MASGETPPDKLEIYEAPASYKSRVWTKFGFTKDKKNVVCKLCKSIFAYSGNTTNMTVHLRRHHGMMDEQSRIIVTASAASRPTIQPNGSPSVVIKTEPGVLKTVPQTIETNQPTISHTFTTMAKKKCLTIDEKNAITLAIAEYIIDDLRPFRMVESKKFKRLLHVLEPRYVIPSRQHFSEAMLPTIYEKVKVLVTDELSNTSTVALTTDGWTSRVTESYVTVTAQFINQNWTMTSYVLQTRLMEESHTGQNIAHVLLDAIAEWGLESKKPALVSDNASNMVVAARESELKPFVRCFAHTLNLCAQKGLKVAAVATLLSKIRRIVTYFHKSSQAASSLKEKQKLLGVKSHKLKIDVSTRWNSAYDMVERYLEQQAAVYAALVDTKHLRKRSGEVSSLTDNDHKNAECVVNTMKELKTATQAMCTETGPTLSLVFPLLHKLLSSLSVTANDKGLIKTMKESMSSDLSKRYVDDMELLKVASFLDPRVKDLPFLSDEERENLVDIVHAMTLAEAPAVLSKPVQIKQEPQEESVPLLPALPTLPGLPEPEPSMPESSVTPTVAEPSMNHEKRMSPPRKKAALDELLGDVFVTKVDLKPVLTTDQIIQNEIKNFNAEVSIKLKEDPLVWWRERAIFYPHLSCLAKRLLGIPATSVPSERVFSTTGDILSAQRSGLKAKYVDMLVFLKKNLG